MKNLQIDENAARRLYKDATPAFRQAPEDTFGKAFFSQKITDRVKTYEDACRENGETPLNETYLKSIGFTIDEINYRKLKSIIKALNENWVPDWRNGNQKKWQPYFTLSSGVFVFDDTIYYYSAADAGSGSRLCLFSDELARYAGTQFSDVYEGFMF